MKAAPLPERRSLRTLRVAARGCRACQLWRRATQTVFGEGSAKADVMLVGEQPGNDEDLAGRPFVGPAGRVLSKALEEAGIDRDRTYVTNVVKHFKWEPRGKRRIHAKPNASEIGACRPWLDSEIAILRPRVIVCLGATAAKALLGASFKVSTQRGLFVESTLAPLVTSTVHPSSILREKDSASRHEAMRAFVRDLKKVAVRLKAAPTTVIKKSAEKLFLPIPIECRLVAAPAAGRCVLRCGVTLSLPDVLVGFSQFCQVFL